MLAFEGSYEYSRGRLVPVFRDWYLSCRKQAALAVEKGDTMRIS